MTPSPPDEREAIVRTPKQLGDDIYREGVADGEAVERSAIVRYLRECQAIHESRIENGPHKTASRHHADACKYASAAIERGEHHLPSEQGEG